MTALFSKIIVYLKEVRSEAKKVDWPSRETVIRYTIIVIGVSVAVAVFLGIVDLLFSEGLKRFIL